MPQYKNAVLGGTFDHLHAGHKRILDFAFHIADHVHIGVTSDDFVKDKNLANLIEPYSTRIESVKQYILENKLESRSSFEVLSDIHGSAAESDSIDLIVATGETKANAVEINKRRKSLGKKELKIVTVPFLKGTDGKIIRSTLIRQGKINRSGYTFASQFQKSTERVLPPRMRELMRKPLGMIIEGELRFANLTAQKAVKKINRLEPTMVIAVGDVISDSLKKAGLTPDISIVDYRTRRMKISPGRKKEVYDVTNPAGLIRSVAVRKIKKQIEKLILKKKAVKIVIKGEEDLLVLPAALLAPLGSIVVYGQADFGIILVKVNESIKEKIYGLIKQFD